MIYLKVHFKVVKLRLEHSFSLVPAEPSISKFSTKMSGLSLYVHILQAGNKKFSRY